MGEDVRGGGGEPLDAPSAGVSGVDPRFGRGDGEAGGRRLGGGGLRPELGAVAEGDEDGDSDEVEVRMASVGGEVGALTVLPCTCA